MANIIIPQTFEFTETYENEYKVYGTVHFHVPGGFPAGKFYTNSWTNESQDTSGVCGADAGACGFYLPAEAEPFYIHFVYHQSTCEADMSTACNPMSMMQGLCTHCCSDNAGTGGSIYDYRSDCISSIKMETTGCGNLGAPDAAQEYGDWGIVELSKYAWGSEGWDGYDDGNDDQGGQCLAANLIVLPSGGESWAQWTIQFLNTVYWTEMAFVGDDTIATEAGKTGQGAGVTIGELTPGQYKYTILPNGTYRSGQAYCGPGLGDPDEACVPEDAAIGLYEYGGPYGTYEMTDAGMITIQRPGPSANYPVGTVLEADTITDETNNEFGNSCIKWSGPATKWNGRSGNWESTSCVSKGDDEGDTGSNFSMPQGIATITGAGGSVYRSPWNNTTTAPWPPLNAGNQIIPRRGLKIMKSYDDWDTRSIQVVYLATDGRWVSVPNLPTCESAQCFGGDNDGNACAATSTTVGTIPDSGDWGHQSVFYNDCPPSNRSHGTYELNQKDETLILYGLLQSEECRDQSTGVEIDGMGGILDCHTAGGFWFDKGYEIVKLGFADGFTDGMMLGTIEHTQNNHYWTWNETCLTPENDPCTCGEVYQNCGPPGPTFNSLGAPCATVAVEEECDGDCTPEYSVDESCQPVGNTLVEDNSWSGDVITYPARYATTEIVVGAYGMDWSNVGTIYINSDINFVAGIRHSDNNLNGPDFGVGIASYYVGQLGVDATDAGDYPGGWYLDDPCGFTQWDEEWDWSQVTEGAAWGYGGYKRWYGYGFTTDFACSDCTNEETWTHEPVGFRTPQELQFTSDPPDYSSLNMVQELEFTYMNPLAICDNENVECGGWTPCGAVFDDFDYTNTFWSLDGSLCEDECEGCTDPSATNYDPGALYDDYSCEYGYEATQGVVCDANESGDANISDLVLTIAWLLGTGTLTDQGLANVDANADGVVNIQDIVTCVNCLLGLSNVCDPPTFSSGGDKSIARGLKGILTGGTGDERYNLEQASAYLSKNGYRAASAGAPRYKNPSAHRFSIPNRTNKRKRLMEKRANLPKIRRGRRSR